jgi:hypothetical protein
VPSKLGMEMAPEGVPLDKTFTGRCHAPHSKQQ